jgi:hypothetical protein
MVDIGSMIDSVKLKIAEKKKESLELRKIKHDAYAEEKAKVDAELLALKREEARSAGKAKARATCKVGSSGEGIEPSKGSMFSAFCANTESTVQRTKEKRGDMLNLGTRKDNYDAMLGSEKSCSENNFPFRKQDPSSPFGKR